MSEEKNDKQQKKNGKKSAVIVAAILLIAAGAYLAGGVFKQKKRPKAQVAGTGIERVLSNLDEEIVPDGSPDVRGQFVEINGDQIVVETVKMEMNEEDRGETQKKMQSLSDGGRQQMREARRAEREKAEKEKIYVAITDETIVMKSGDSGEPQEIEISKLDEGKNVMIWEDENGATLILQAQMERKQ